MYTHFFTVTFALFLLMNPIGNVPIYLALLKEIAPKRQAQIILRELAMALAILLLFQFVGQGLLNLLGVKKDALLIAGGLILLIIAMRMIFPPEKSTLKMTEKKEEPFLVPLAIPLVAGPAILSAIIVYSNEVPTLPLTFAILFAWALVTVILVSAPVLLKILKERGIVACERLMGLILILIASQMFLNGMRIFFSELR
ncbi:MAG: MarC family protein [Chlamydiales bacterium]